MRSRKLTSWEWNALISEVNLADGHAHQSLNISQNRVINNLSSLFQSSYNNSQEVIQDEFEKEFFKIAGQYSYSLLPPPQYHYACSISIEVVANYLRLNNKSLSLIHPTFDNLADIFRRHKVKLFPLEESTLDYINQVESISTDALMLVCPNNPTGKELSKKQFKSIIDVCKKNKLLLIIDFSFRFYSKFTQWDQYKILIDSGLDFIVLEDTGKTFPTQDLKLGIMLSSNSIYQALKDISDDFLLNVSPFIFQLLTNYIKSEQQTVLSYQKIVQKHKIIIVKAFLNSKFKVQNPSSKISVAWIKLPPDINSQYFCKWLAEKGIFVLPGNPFYWNHPIRGNSYFRVALARPSSFFIQAIDKLKNACEEYWRDGK